MVRVFFHLHPDRKIYKILDRDWFLRTPVCHVISARSRGYPIVIGHLRYLHVNYVYFNGFFFPCSLLCLKLMKTLLTLQVNI